MNQLWHNGRVKCGWGVEGGEGTGGELGQPHSLARAAVAGHRQRSAGRPHAGARAVVIVASGAIAALQVFYFFFGWKREEAFGVVVVPALLLRGGYFSVCISGWCPCERFMMTTREALYVLGRRDVNWTSVECC